MDTQFQRRFAIVLAGVLFASTSASAAPITLTATDAGWYNSLGQHFETNINYIAGEFDGLEYRNFFVFDLSSVTGFVESAALVLNTENIITRDASETYTLFDVSTPGAALVGATGGISAFNDLGTGTVYGQRIYTQADANLLRSIILNADGLSYVQALVGQTLVLGGALTTLADPITDSEAVFAFSRAVSPQLVLEVTSVPEPASALLVAIGLAAVGVTRWRERRR